MLRSCSDNHTDCKLKENAKPAVSRARAQLGAQSCCARAAKAQVMGRGESRMQPLQKRWSTGVGIPF